VASDSSLPTASTGTSVAVSPLRLLLDAVNMSILPHDLRLASIQQAVGFFDHRDRTTHDNELRQGAANILYQKLAFALSLNNRLEQDSYRIGGDVLTADHEISLLCNCLEMVHRASPDAIAATWYDVGEDILPILVKVMERPFLQHYGGETKPNRDLKLAVQKVTKLLAMYSLVPEAKFPMVHCPGVLHALVMIIDTRNLSRARLSIGGASRCTGTGLVMTEAARFNTIATLTNLAAAEENRITMLQTEGLVDNIARIVQNERSEVARQCSALAIMNLSNGDKDHVPEMASELVLETLIILIKDELPETRRNAAVALFNVACADANTLPVARYKDGAILDAILEIICNDEIEESRTDAAETLFNMSCSEEEETTNRMANHPGLLENVALVLHSPLASIDVKLYCAATLRRMAEIIVTPMPAQSIIMIALIKSATWTHTADIAEGFQAHSEHVGNRKSMVEHVGLLHTLAQLAQTDTPGAEGDKIRIAAIHCIENLAMHDRLQPVLASNEDILLALTKASYAEPGEGNPVQVALRNLLAAV